MEAGNSSAVRPEENLARFIFRKEHVRTDGTIKADPFIPFRHVELSVTRHGRLDEAGIWAAGRLVGSQMEKMLLGRGDVKAEAFMQQRLAVLPDPIPGNPNHANVRGWPQEKHAQKEIALEVAKRAVFVACEANGSIEAS